MLFEIDIHPTANERDIRAEQLITEARDLGIDAKLAVATAHGYLIEGDITTSDAERAAAELLVDSVVERAVVAKAEDDALLASFGRSANDTEVVYVLPKPGVTDAVAETARRALAEIGIKTTAVATFTKYWIASPQSIRGLATLLANDAIERVVFGKLPFTKIEHGSNYTFTLRTVAIREMDDTKLEKLSRDGQLYLSLDEMRTIREHFKSLDRDPTDIELETVAQTWSEHCSHKTLAGRIHYRGPEGERRFDNMLKETIFAATQKIRVERGADDLCVSVFADNAGVVRFDDETNVCFKVETHNHPSAIEPYGGANTGLGGVIRDPMGTGMGAKPVCSTDVFCFAPPDFPHEKLPSGVLHPRRVMKGVVSGVRDYGNRMGIPTVNGAVYFDERYLGNPLVFCGNVGILPREMSFKEVKAGDLIVALGGRTGRDGIHGATFSSAELTHESETISGGAVQIGNAITQKMVLDVMLQARDRGLYNAVTDCGAGGFSSAVGEMGETLGADVNLDSIPTKYAGLSYTEVWISEAQERMVFAVPPEKWETFHSLCAAEGVEATVLGTFAATGRLVLRSHNKVVGDLDMSFLHKGRPPVVRDAVYTVKKIASSPKLTPRGENWGDDLCAILASLNVASKHWIIRQYDHEVQGGSVVKPLTGIHDDGPSDAAVVRPKISSRRGIVLSCGMNPHFGDFDTAAMAASAIDEAIRNNVAVGADPKTIAILDNFCWGNTSRAETLGSLVRAAMTCYDAAIAFGTPFISGKDSLNNEFKTDVGESISIPPSLLISAMGQIDDVSKCVTMDFKTAGNLVYQVGATHDEMGGSHLHLVRLAANDRLCGNVPQVDYVLARNTFVQLHKAMGKKLVRACHDISEGGLAAALAEMCIAGDVGANIDVAKLSASTAFGDAVVLFSESNSRFVCEVTPENAAAFESLVPNAAYIGTVGGTHLNIHRTTQTPLVNEPVTQLRSTWQKPLDW
ncbi:MAG: phosphoribosylformylglycinamidine synthase subunit PurL [Thermoguttaceae bacterium]